jgi:hypothetical protein
MDRSQDNLGEQVGVSTWDGTYERHDATTGERLGVIDGLMTDQG